jgi:hypothetical protein
MSNAVRHMDAKASARTFRRDLRRVVVLAAALALAYAGSSYGQGTRAGASETASVHAGSAVLAARYSPSGSGAAKTGGAGVSKDGLVLNVVNNSSHDLHWVGDGNGPDPTSTPKDTIPANGGTDRIVFSGTNLQIQPTWQVAGTQKNVFPSFGVPLVGFNGFSCTVDDISKGSPVGMTHCDIGKGYDPDAHVTFGNAPESASIPKDS